MSEKVNNAVLPVPNTEKDFYDWNERRALKLSQVQSGNHELIFIGDSITHGFERPDRGAAVWAHYFGNYRALNLGYGWDCTQNVLWRLENGEFEGQTPKRVVLLIGTNNLTGNSGGRANSAAEIVEGIEAILRVIQDRAPDAKNLVMAILPRGKRKDKIFGLVRELNGLLATRLEEKAGVDYLDIGDRFLGPDGEIPLELMDDRVHPTAKGYEIWAEAIVATVRQNLE